MDGLPIFTLQSAKQQNTPLGWGNVFHCKNKVHSQQCGCECTHDYLLAWLCASFACMKLTGLLLAICEMDQQFTKPS